jgi:hypothetical protein
MKAKRGGNRVLDDGLGSLCPLFDARTTPAITGRIALDETMALRGVACSSGVEVEVRMRL